jgi:hypothetical protein
MQKSHYVPFSFKHILQYLSDYLNQDSPQFKLTQELLIPVKEFCNSIQESRNYAWSRNTYANPTNSPPFIDAIEIFKICNYEKDPKKIYTDTNLYATIYITGETEDSISIVETRKGIPNRISDLEKRIQDYIHRKMVTSINKQHL